MILSSNGQNIYPEEIEAKLNNMPYVAESLVIERNGRLVALVYPDYEATIMMLNPDVNNESMALMRKEAQACLDSLANQAL